MTWIEQSSADGGKLGFSWRPKGLDTVGVLSEGTVIVAHRDDGVFHVPESLVDGTISAPKPWGEHAGWICEQDYDFLIYAFSNGGGESFAGEKAARVNCAVGSYDYNDLTKETVDPMKAGLWSRLCAAGFAAPTGRIRKVGTTECRVYDLLVPPQVSPDGLRPSGVRATIYDLEAEGEPYFFVPRVVMTKKMWKQLRYHWLRRILLAIYCYNDLETHGGVDPEVIRLEEGRVWVSDEFMAAAGNDDLEQVVRGVDFLAHGCGLGNWIPVDTDVATTGPGVNRLFYRHDCDDGRIAVFRPTLQHKPAWQRWRKARTVIDV